MAPLVMPTEDNPVSTYDLSVFCEKVIGGHSPNPSMRLDLTICPQSSAIVCSLELLKYQSWRHWWHEFVVFDIHYEGKDYVVHINRGWTGDGWWEYIPWVTWGSVKAAEDCVAIYIPGEAERREREGVRRVYRLVFDGENVALGQVVFIQYLANTSSAPYSLFGMNCWGTSRVLTAGVVVCYSSFIVSAEDHHGRTTLDAVSLALRRDPWMHFNLTETIVVSPLDRKSNASRCVPLGCDTLPPPFLNRFTTGRLVRSSTGVAFAPSVRHQVVQTISYLVCGQTAYPSSVLRY